MIIEIKAATTTIERYVHSVYLPGDRIHLIQRSESLVKVAIPI